MRITFVFEDGVMDTNENRETFKLALDEALKNVDDIFQGDQADIEGDAQSWRSKFYEKTDNEWWGHAYWVVDRHKMSPKGSKSLGRSYIPECLYSEYMRWYFKMWLRSGQIIEII